jgi:hypothetical protein
MANKLIYASDARRAILKEDPKLAYCIDNIPGVDAVEVVHGQWLDGCAIHNGKEVYKSIDCSVCNDVFKIESESLEYWKARFKVCPFCGAKMDGGNEDV